MLGDQDRVGLLLVYSPPPRPCNGALAGAVGHVTLESPEQVVLDDFSIHAKALDDKTAQDMSWNCLQ